MAEEEDLLYTIVFSLIDNPHSCDKNTDPNWLDVWSQEEIKIMQANDTIIKNVLNFKSNSQDKPSKQETTGLHPETKILLGQWENLLIVNGIYYKKLIKEHESEILRLVAPKEIREIIFYQLYYNKIDGHFGIDRTLNSIRSRFYWPYMNEDIKQWCSECDICARCKPGPGVGKSPLRQTQCGAPLERIGIDIVGPLPLTENGNEYIIVVGDYLIKWKEAYSVPNHIALTVADKLLTEFICRYGCPLSIHSDQGREFEFQLFEILCQKLGIHKPDQPLTGLKALDW